MANESSTAWDVAIVGAGAAGLATAIFAARQNASLRIALLDGARRPGAKILVSGGGRCNVTNVRVTPDDFQGGSRNTIRRVLNALPVDRTIEFFREIGVTLHEEENGKLFPDTNSARTILDALLTEAERLGVHCLWDHRVETLRQSEPGAQVTGATTQMEPEARARGSSTPTFELHAGIERVLAKRLVLATGGLSLPKTGSDGVGYTFTTQLGHSLVPTIPALVPLVLNGTFHIALSGISHEVEIAVHVAGDKPARWRGSMLWTHFGISGPVVLNASARWHRARLERRDVNVTANLLPEETFESAEARFVASAQSRPRTELHTILAEILPARLADALLDELHIGRDILLAHFSREDRRRLVHALLAWPLPVRDSRGYTYAEVTSGGVPLSEIDPGTMQSRIRPGLHLVGEILDVDGRIGGFNFQWAWATGFVAGSALAQNQP